VPERITPAAAAAELARRDRVVARLVTAHGPPRLGRPVAGAGRFKALAESIVYQQLTGRAAATIFGRVDDCLGGDVTPQSIQRVGAESLRGCGLSTAKTAALLDLAAKVSGGVVRLERIGRLSDDEVVDELVKVKGIGRWTAEMFLLFTLGRLDVWPVGDYGVRVGYAKAWELAEVPEPAELGPLGDRFRPYRSVAAWYCWRAVEQR
jgi:3-methyladenine DNA glycosylase/8-oxoguanine DNA glycosylase